MYTYKAIDLDVKLNINHFEEYKYFFPCHW